MVPAADLYPHQWLWDSCFIAIGLRHLDIERAQTELTSLLRGQWSNGMLPNIIFSEGHKYHRDRELWRSYLSPYSPDGVSTSGLTQPPMLAEAVVQVGEKLKLPERRSWYKKMYPALVRYHEWLPRSRSQTAAWASASAGAASGSDELCRSSHICATARARFRTRPMYAARSVTESAPRASSRLNVWDALSTWS